MEDCSWLGQTMLQFLGTSPSPWPIDSEVGDLADGCLTPQPSLHYQRYDVVLSPGWLERNLGQHISANDIAQLAHIDRPALIPRLLELARIAAARQVQPDHLPRSFDAGITDTPARPVPVPSR